MASNLNPYQSPNYQHPKTKSLLSWLRDLVFGTPNDGKRLLRGEPIMQYGVLFFINTENEAVVFAAVPIHEINDTSVDLAAQEAIRELHKLVESHKQLQEELGHRKLSVGIVDTYGEYKQPVCTRAVDDWQSLTIADVSTE